jgi:hypothetical protein
MLLRLLHHDVLCTRRITICTALRVEQYFSASTESNPSRNLVDFGKCCEWMMKVVARSDPKSTATQASKPSNCPPTTPYSKTDPILARLLPFTPKLLGTVREGVKPIVNFENVLFLFGISTEHGIREPFVWVLEAEYPRDSALQRDGLVWQSGVHGESSEGYDVVQDGCAIGWPFQV